MNVNTKISQVTNQLVLSETDETDNTTETTAIIKLEQTGTVERAKTDEMRQD